MLQSRWPDNFFKLDMEAQTVPCLGLSASKSVQQVSQYGRGPACLPPGTRIQSFLAMLVFCHDVFEPPAQQAWLEQHPYAFPLSREVCSCMPEGISVAAVLPRRAQPQLSVPRAGVGDGLGTHLVQEALYKTARRQPARELQTLCEMSILLVCVK